MLIHTLPMGDEVHFYDYALVIPFCGKRKVLSTSPLNGGYREDIQAVFNYDSHPGLGVESVMEEDTYEEHIKNIASSLGLDAATAAGLVTAANMENVSLQSETFEDLTVTAIATGGLSVNGGRVGDPASWHERSGRNEHTAHGTVNIILYISANLSPGCMTRAVVTCTEAKSAAIQELQEGSQYSRGLATGSGTDGTIIVSNAESDIYLTNAGKHCKLGELIGRTVLCAVKEALKKQTGLSPEMQHSALRRLKRFGVTSTRIYDCHIAKPGEDKLGRPWFSHHLELLERRGDVLAMTSCLTQLFDELDWGLLSAGEMTAAAQMLAGNLAAAIGVGHAWLPVSSGSKDQAIQGVIDNWIRLLALGTAAYSADDA